MGVLAQADHETIEGETFSVDMFSPQELEQAKSLPWLPRSVKDRTAKSAERTQRIVEAYETHVHLDWPTLIFATSVEHAKTVAALLTRKGIRSRAVSGETETAVRRRIVEEFRSGEIRALVNYGVFREGFDAPRTRAVIVARPVYRARESLFPDDRQGLAWTEERRRRALSRSQRPGQHREFSASARLFRTRLALV